MASPQMPKCEELLERPMSYFSRLTDIVTCNLTQLLEEAPHPLAAMKEILAEMEEGLAGARRAVATATASVVRLEVELTEHEKRVAYWLARTKEELAADNENQARLALIRKREVEDLIAGLKQQLTAATATCAHLTTTQRALEARLAEATRKQQQLLLERTGAPWPTPSNAQGRSATPESPTHTREREIDAELESLKRELSE
jgi:phage shock protein A